MPTPAETAKIDDQSTSGTGLADDGTDSVTVDTDGASTVYVFVDDDNTSGTVGDHAGYELTIEVEGDVGGTTRFQEYTTLGSDSSAETARSWTLDAIPTKMKITLTNRSGGTADYALRAVSLS